MVLLIFKRIGFMIFTMIVVSIILFLLLETGLTGDPATRVLGNFASDEQKEMWRDQQVYLHQFAHGDHSQQQPH